MSSMKPDCGYGWIVVLCCFYMNMAFFGVYRSAGILFVAFLEEYGISREEASWPFTLCGALFQFTGPFSSLLGQIMTVRKLTMFGVSVATASLVACYFATNIFWIILFYGVFHGMGYGLAFIWIPVMINQYFVKYRATAMGCSFAGSTVGGLIFPPLMKFLLSEYGLSGTFLIMGGVFMNSIVACSLLQSPPWLKEDDKKPTQDTSPSTQPKPSSFAEHLKALKTNISNSFSSSIGVILTNPMSYVLATSTAVFYLGIHTFYVVVVDYARDKNIPEYKSVYLLSIFSFADLFGRLGLGWITDKKYIRRKNMFMINMGSIGVFMMLYPMFDDFVWFSLTEICHGIVAGNAAITMYVLQAEYFGLKNQVFYGGLSGVITCLALANRSPIIGVFRDTIGSYDWMFRMYASFYLILAAVWLLEPCLTRKAPSADQTEDTTKKDVATENQA